MRVMVLGDRGRLQHHIIVGGARLVCLRRRRTTSKAVAKLLRQHHVDDRIDEAVDDPHDVSHQSDGVRHARGFT